MVATQRDSCHRAEYVNVLAPRRILRPAKKIATLVTDLIRRKEIDSVYIIFSEFKTLIDAKPWSKALPFEPFTADEESVAKERVSQVDYIYEQPV